MKRARGTVLGVASGALGMLAYLVSCGGSNISTSHGDGATPVAAIDVGYTGTGSGLRAGNVQAAIDEIGTTVRTATTTARTALRSPEKKARGLVRSAHADDGAPSAGPTTWTVQVSTLDTASETLGSSAGGTVTFTETADGQGTYATSGNNVLLKSGLFGLPAKYDHTGKYFIVGNSLVVTARQSGGAADGLSWRLSVADAGKTMTLDDGTAFLVLTKN